MFAVFVQWEILGTLVWSIVISFVMVFPPINISPLGGSSVARYPMSCTDNNLISLTDWIAPTCPVSSSAGRPPDGMISCTVAQPTTLGYWSPGYWTLLRCSTKGGRLINHTRPSEKVCARNKVVVKLAHWSIHNAHPLASADNPGLKTRACASVFGLARGRTSLHEPART